MSVVRLGHHFVSDDEGYCWECGETQDHPEHKPGSPLESEGTR